MTDPNRQNENPANAAQAGEPVVSKPYVMPDDPEQGSVEALAREAAESRDKMLRTLAEMENLRKRTSRDQDDVLAGDREQVVEPRAAEARLQAG